MSGAANAIERWFTAQPEITCERVGDGWLTVLRGERKRTLPVYLEVGERTLTLQSFFMTAPDENQAELYAFLLRRHTRSYLSRFALDRDGDVLLTAVLPVDAVTVDELDRVLGQLLVLADDTFDQALKLGFASYIEREQSWRENVGLKRNPIT
jgi:hypothetical protein